MNQDFRNDQAAPGLDSCPPNLPQSQLTSSVLPQSTPQQEQSQTQKELVVSEFGQSQESLAGREMNQPQLLEMRQSAAADSFRRYGGWALLFGTLYIFCTFRNSNGITWAVLPVGGVLLFRKARDKRSGRMQLFYEISLILLGIGVCTSGSWVLNDLNFIAMLLLAASMCVHAYCEDRDWGIARHLFAVLRVIFLPLRFLITPFADAAAYIGKARNGRRNRYTGAIVRGILIAIPLLIVVLALLAGADEVFERMLDHMIDGITVPERIGDVIEVLLGFVFGFVVFYTVVKAMPKEADTLSRDKEITGRHDPVTAVTFMSLLGVVYVVFAVIQLVFLIGRHELPARFTYAEYAHQGFAQLIVVCILNLVLITICGKYFRDNRVLNVILVVVCLCTYVMIASSALRMMMYVREYSMTFLRLFVLWFLIVLTLWLTFITIGTVRRNHGVFRRCLIAITVLYLVFSFLHPDYWIAKINMATAVDGQIRDEYYVLGLSVDALPAIAADPELLEEKREYYYEVPGHFTDPRTLNLMELATRHYLMK